MVGIRMTMADIIIQMVLVVADREAWWWCALRHDDVPCSDKIQMNHLTLSWMNTAFIGFFPPVQPHPHYWYIASAEAVNISKGKFVMKMSPGQTWFEKSGWGLVKGDALCPLLYSYCQGLACSTRQWQRYSRKLQNTSLSLCNTPIPRNCSHQVTAVFPNAGKTLRES